jgi:hypothetical protein
MSVGAPVYTVLVFHPDAGMPGNMLAVMMAPADAQHWLDRAGDGAHGDFLVIDLPEVPGVSSGGAVRVRRSVLSQVVLIGEGTARPAEPMGRARVLPVSADGFPPGFVGS